MLYVDLHAKAAHAPAADPGAVVAYEYERTMRPYVQEYTWEFQDSIPILHSVFELVLPSDWHYSVAARRDAGVVTSQPAPSHYRWQIDRVSGIDTEDVPLVPEFESIAGRLVVHYSRDPSPPVMPGGLLSATGTPHLPVPAPRPRRKLRKSKELVAGQTDFTARFKASPLTCSETSAMSASKSASAASPPYRR